MNHSFPGAWWGIVPPRRDVYADSYGVFQYRTVTTTDTSDLVSDEEAVRRIVRQELADLMPIDVPDTLPEED